jgi:hypothetical protein
MEKAQLEITMIYLGAFKNRAEWTPEDHLAGLKAVWLAGAGARTRSDAEAVSE